jgi:hypothetical protein
MWRELGAKALAGAQKLLNGCKFVFIITVFGFFVARWF